MPPVGKQFIFGIHRIKQKLNMNITRIKPPKWRVGRYVLNEYEVRCLMADVCLGKKQPGIKITDSDGRTAEILPDGRLTDNLKGFDVSGNYTLILLREARRKHGS